MNAPSDMRANVTFEDEGYRWREDEIATLPPNEACALLLEDAREEAEHQEWEVSYRILRELCGDFPKRARRGDCLRM